MPPHLATDVITRRQSRRPESAQHGRASHERQEGADKNNRQRMPPARIGSRNVNRPVQPR
jgi:hypothetical protein